MRFFRWCEPDQLTQRILGFIFRFLEGHYTYSLSHKNQISEAYRLRWRIEVCFKQLKSQGFKASYQEKTYRNGKQSLVVSLFRQGLSVLRSQIKS